MTLPANRDRWPADALVDFEERAAILEYDGKLPRAEADARAEQIIRATWKGRP